MLKLVARIARCHDRWLLLDYNPIAPATTPQPRVQQVSHRIAKHVYPIDHNSQGKARPKNHPPSLVHIHAPTAAKHTPPARKRGRYTKAEEAQASLTENYCRYIYGKHDNCGRHNMRQDVPSKYPVGGAANSHRRLHINILFRAENKTSNYPGPTDTTYYPQSNDQWQHTWLNERHYDHQHRQPGQAHHGINEPLHYQVEPTTDIPTQNTYEDGDEHIRTCRSQAYNQRYTSPVDDTTKQVSPQVIGAQPEVG